MDSAWGIGLMTVSAANEPLDVWFPEPLLGLGTSAAVEGTNGMTAVNVDMLDPRARAAAAELAGAQRRDSIRNVHTRVKAVVISALDKPPADTADAYLRLHLLSHRLVQPHGLNLDGIFGALPNVAWTSLGPCAVEDIPAVQLRARTAGTALSVWGVDKFPRMTDYVVPSGVRIADADRVRLGAHLAAGTTVMHEGFINFNAGTLGASMIEGRISAGVLVGDGTDIGGGASIMGTLSGGGKEVISLGKRCLLGANSGIGISLGDDCVVEAGCYITTGTKVTLPDGRVVKARDLSGTDGLLFRRNSVTGTVEAVARTGTWGGLNTALHQN